MLNGNLMKWTGRAASLMNNLDMDSKIQKAALKPPNGLQCFNSLKSDRDVKSSLRSLRHSSRQETPPSPEVDSDITILNETPKQKADRLLAEANKRDITLMATSSRPTTRYAALYAASKNRGLDASLGRNLTFLESMKKKKLKMIQQSQKALKDDFKKTKKVCLRREKQFAKQNYESSIYTEKKKSQMGHNRLGVKLPPINLRKTNSL